MKKRILTISLVLALLVGLIVITTTATEQGTLQAGYAAISISPTKTDELDLTVGLPMSGYGNVEDRLSTGFINDDGDDTNGTIDAGHELMATVVAVTDGEDTTALLISVDTNNTNQNWTNAARTDISKATGVPYHNIFIHASGTLSAPEIAYGYTYTDEEITNLGQSEDPDDQALYTILFKAEKYRQYVTGQLVKAAVEAMADRTDVTMAKGELDVSDAVLLANPDATTAQQKMNYNTHYLTPKTVDGVETVFVSGSDFGPSLTSDSTELTEADDTMYLLQFTPTDAEKSPIVLANWRAMPNLSSNGYTAYGADHRYKISSDYVGSFRDAITTQNYRASFLIGADANVSAFHRSATNWDPDVTVEYTPTIRPDDVNANLKSRPSISPVKYGQKLAAAALYGLNSSSNIMKSVASGKVQTMAMQFSTNPNLPTDAQIDLVVALSSEPAPDGTNYDNLCRYLIANWSKKTEYQDDERFTELKNIKTDFELAGISQRASHTVFENRTNFATDAAFCEMHAMMIGEEVAFVISPMELYDRYSKTATLADLSDNDWQDLQNAVYGTPFIMTHSNGSSGTVPNYLAASYNATSDTYATGSRDFHYCSFERGTGEDVLHTYVNMFHSLTATDGDHILRCECGGAAAGKPGHTCEDVEWLAWSDPNNLPSYGNYYLTCDVTFMRQLALSRRTLRLDLNGHTLTREVLPEEILVPGDEVPEKDYYAGTRALSLTGGVRLVITDSSAEKTGKFTRDISALSETDCQRVSNYGLLISMNNSCTNEVVLYDGTLDVTGQYSGGGACVANMSTAGATFKMYGGTLMGGVSDFGTVIYNSENVELRGGEIVGGTVADTSDEGDIAQNNGAVIVTGSGTITLANDASVTGCVGPDGVTPNNITLNGKVFVEEGYTGYAGITVNNSQLNGRIIGKHTNVSDAVLSEHLTLDSQPADDTAVYSIVGVEEDDVMIAELRTYCECGGKVTDGTYGHTCKDITWKPWPYAYTKYLPTSTIGGNYYLLTDIELVNQKTVAAEMHLDLNGHNITHKVQPSSINIEDNKESTRVFYVISGGSLTITDSTNTPGVITRDLTLLDEETKNNITNWGLIILIAEVAGGDVVLYDGTLDATDMVSGGGATVANLCGTQAFRMYGGTLNGGKSEGGGNIYTAGPVELYGGTVTGGINTKSTVKGAGVRIASLDGGRVGSLTLGGDATITGNFRGDIADNIHNLQTYEQFTVSGKYTGTAGISLKEKPYEAMKIGISDNADITEANLTVENYADCDILNKDGYLILNTNAAYITTDSSVKYKSLASAIEAYPGGDAVIVLLRNIDENDLAITQQTYLDLHGFNVANTGFNANGNKLYVLDSLTDDYTVEDGDGYGKVTGDIAAVAEGVPEEATVTLDGYMRIVENDAVSFHRLNLRIVGIGLRPANVGVYYQSQFGGDEIIKKNIVAYGTALGALENPTFRDKTYTRLLAETWLVGADKDGNSNNLKNGTLLKDILMPEYTYSIASRNANATVFGLSYVELPDGKRVCGPMIGYSLKDLFVGNNITGVDASWETYDDTTKAGILDMYSTYNNVMKRWNIPNIKAAASAQS